MDNVTYRKNVLRTLSTKDAKIGLRNVTRKRKTLDLFHAIMGVSTEVGEVQTALYPYLQGHPLNAAVLAAARPEFGDLLYFVCLAAKNAGVKLPASTKKSRLKGMTPTQAILSLSHLSTEMLSGAKKVMYGRSLLDEAVSERISKNLCSLIVVLWGLIYTLYEVTPSVLMHENIEKLKLRFPDGVFDADKADAQLDQAPMSPNPTNG